MLNIIIIEHACITCVLDTKFSLNTVALQEFSSSTKLSSCFINWFFFLLLFFQTCMQYEE